MLTFRAGRSAPASSASSRLVSKLARRRGIVAAAAALAVSASSAFAGNFQNFTVSTYILQSTVTNMMNGRMDPKESLAYIQKRLPLDKIYIETMRNRTLVDENGLETLKKIYQDAGLKVAGGIAYSVNESNGYQGFDYADPEDRKFVQEAAEMAARHFDEILLDDYFFFNRKTDLDIKAKGDKTWSQFRLETMRDVVENLVVKPAHKVNPNCKVIVKFANWWSQWHSMGNDTEKTPFIADGMYSGTESRTWVGQEQRMMPYQSYNIMRFMDNLNPGVNKGGWVDLGGSNPIDRYAEELWNTVFAKRPEMTCFEYTGMLSGLRNRGTRAWADDKTSFNFDALKADLTKFSGSADVAENPGMAGAAGYSLRQADAFLGKLGKPVGVKGYTPYHAGGEDFLQDYFGMIGVPQDIYPQFPTDAAMVFLTEQAAKDEKIVDKIKAQLVAGKNVTITSGLLRALKGKGIEDICEIEPTGNSVLINHFGGGNGPGAQNRGGLGQEKTPHDILIPEIHYWNILTHDAWGELMGITNAGTAFPMVVSCDYSKAKLYVVSVPNDPADLFAMPRQAINVIRNLMTQSEPIRIEDAPAQVAIFRYDNDTAIVENYLDTAVTVTVSMPEGTQGLTNLLTEQPVGERPQPQQGGGRFGGFGGGPPASGPARDQGYQGTRVQGMGQPPTRPTTGPAANGGGNNAGGGGRRFGFGGPQRPRFVLEIPAHSFVAIGASAPAANPAP